MSSPRPRSAHVLDDIHVSFRLACEAVTSRNHVLMKTDRIIDGHVINRRLQCHQSKSYISRIDD